MYGSQTGNAQSIAEGLHEGCKGRGLDSSLLKCDAWKKARNREARFAIRSVVLMPSDAFFSIPLRMKGKWSLLARFVPT